VAFEVQRSNADLQVAWLSVTVVLNPFLALDLQDAIKNAIKVDL